MRVGVGGGNVTNRLCVCGLAGQCDGAGVGSGRSNQGHEDLVLKLREGLARASRNVESDRSSTGSAVSVRETERRLSVGPLVAAYENAKDEHVYGATDYA
ncbi:hypothetical protein GN244_ATG09094 [Phytophthora infestans]|uniref:Uncharacterized protein n=1 Tax=Phytophthora infestans TaxID=4787 RepID=A0A833T8U6_PHYIN|nr:hypothetical protein GN244_ATG09094 [Phytophthora infestans]